MTTSSWPDFSLEEEARKEGYLNIVGIDEVGRGAAIGPVVAAAVKLPTDLVPLFLGRAKDSKKLSEKKREEIYEEVIKYCPYGIGSVSNLVIDDINILEATKMAMCQAVHNMKSHYDYLLIDGPIKLPSLGVTCKPVIKGDNTSLSIALASIVAKVYRDRWVIGIDKAFPQYDLANNKGYLTAKHMEALKQYGPTDFHRLTFAKVLV